MNSSPPPVDPTLVGIASALGRVEGAVEAMKEALLPLTAKVDSHDKDINRSKGALAALGALWLMLVAGLGLVFGFWKR